MTGLRQAGPALVLARIVLARIILATLAGPALAGGPAAAGEALVTAQGADAVEVVDLDAGRVVARIAVGGAPAGIALSPDRATAYVTRPEAPGLAVIDLAARRVRAAVPLPGGPLGIAVNPKTGAVYVADWYARRVFALRPDPQAGAVLDGEIAVGASPSGIAVTPDGATILVANREDDSVSVIDAATRTEVRRIPVGRHPFGITLDASGARAYTANVTGNDVSVIDVAAGREIGRVKTGERPYVVALSGGRGFVTDQYSGTVTVFDTDSLGKTATIAVGDHPEGIAASRDGRTLYVANWGSNTLSVIDAATLVLTKDIPVADGPRAFGDFVR